MKAIPLLLSLLAVAGMSYWQKSEFSTQLQPDLKKQVLQVLHDSQVADPRVTLTYLDAEIHGSVSNLEERELIAEDIDQLPGIRLTEEGNYLRSRGYLEIKRNGPLTEVSGEIHSADFATADAIARSATKTLTKSDFIDSPHGLSSPALAQAVQAILLPAGGRTIRINALSQNEQLIHLSGCATPQMQKQWEGLLEGLDGTRVELYDLQMYPSIYHFPDYLPHSVLPVESQSILRSALLDSQIFFETGSAEIPPAEEPKLNALARSITSAGTTIRYVLGGHTDATGGEKENAALSQARAQSVLDQLIQKGLPAAQFEIVSFGASAAGKSLDGPESDRRVEILLK